MRILFLDDNSRRHKTFRRNAVGHQVDHAYSAAEAIRLLGDNAYDVVYLDYDLSDDPEELLLDDYESGHVVAQWLAENALGRHDGLFVVHSLNHDGAFEMVATLKSAGLRVVREEWAWQKSPHFEHCEESS